MVIELRNAGDRYAVALVVQVIIPVESHYFQFEFMRITLPSRLSCFHHVQNHLTTLPCLTQRSENVPCYVGRG